METTISGRRYWKVGEQWYRELLSPEERTAGYQVRFKGKDCHWSNGNAAFIPIEEESGRVAEYRAPCDDPTAATVVREGDAVSTPMGTAKVVKPESGAIQPVFLDKPDPREFDGSNSPIVKLNRGPLATFFHVYEFKSAEREIGNSWHSIIHFKDGSSMRVGFTPDEISDAITEALRGKRNTPGFAVATEDSKPDGDSHLVKAKLLNGATEEPDSKPQQEATTSSSSSASMLSLRDQFALASLPALIQKYSGQDRFALSVTDRLTMCRESYAIAEDMMKARGE